MKPLKLKLSAFGPYAKEQEIIDFNRLEGRNIFLITGPTGAGKTTIFDAISYALFGEASGSVRDNDSLRSDFAEVDVLTYVELEFLLRGKEYKIKRIPAQMKPKQKGEGYTKQSAEAELHFPDNKVITGSALVTNEITSLLGINKEQFKQIVMLPQGEFKKLLLADSKEREGIFRKIFGTYNFERIQSKLYEDSKEIYKQVDKCKEQMKTNLSNIKGNHNIVLGEYIDFISIIDRLKELIINQEEEYKKSENEYEIVKEKIQNKRNDLSAAKNINILFEDLEKANSEYNELMLRDKEFVDKERDLDDGLKAEKVFKVEEKLEEKKKELVKREYDKSNIDINIKNLYVKKSEIEKRVEEVRENEMKISNLQGELGSLREIEPKFISLSKSEEIIKKINDELEKIKISEKITKEEIEKKKSLLEDRDKKYKKIIDEKILLKDMETTIKEKEFLISKMRNFFMKIIEYNEKKKEHTIKSNEYEHIEKIFLKEKDEYEIIEDLFRRGQAGILASKLVEGEECPVCGSKNHPNKASIESKDIPTEDKVEKYKNKYDKTREQREKIFSELKVIKSQIDSIKINSIDGILKEINEVVFIDEEFNDNTEIKVRLEGVNLKNDIESLMKEKRDYEKNIKKEEEILWEIEQYKKIIDKSNIDLESYRKEFIEKNEIVNKEIGVVSNIKKSLPDGITSIEELHTLIKNKNNEVNNLKKQMEETFKLREDIDKDISRLESSKAEIEKYITEVNIELKRLRNEFDSELKINKFTSLEEYSSSKKIIFNINTLREEILKYKEEKIKLETVINKLLNMTDGNKRTDLNQIESELNILKEQSSIIEKKVMDEYSIIENNKSILKEVKKLNNQFSEMENKYKVIGELSLLANGKKSPYITFERFVLGAYFQEIIDRANIRLAKMTGDRFIMKRKESRGKGISQQGLELEVLDNYTGKNRHVKTLSGGESFKASLALALGLSDVVQNNSGGISIDTMFVDEGFGTLDPESLDSAINCLLDLQQGGRLVGIISHVPELRERIEAKLQISSSALGSSAKFLIG